MFLLFFSVLEFLVCPWTFVWRIESPRHIKTRRDTYGLYQFRIIFLFGHSHFIKVCNQNAKKDIFRSEKNPRKFTFSRVYWPCAPLRVYTVKCMYIVIDRHSVGWVKKLLESRKKSLFTKIRLIPHKCVCA